MKKMAKRKREKEMFKMKVNEKIHLQLLEPRDAKELTKVVRGNQEHLKKWLIWAENKPSVYEYEVSVIPAWLKKFADGNGFEVGVYYQEELVGMIGLHYIDSKNKTTEIGYWLSQSFEGKGIITKAVQKLIDYCFVELKLNRIMIRAAKGNRKSRAIPERLGFVEEGVTREAQYIKGTFHDLVNYSLLKSDRAE